MSLNSTETLFKTVVVEIRPRLQSVNVFIHLYHDSNDDVKIILNEENFQIIRGNYTSIIGCKDIKVLTSSLSSFKVIGNSASFRFATSNNLLDNLGSFKTELLQNYGTTSEFVENKPLLSPNINYVVQCINCSKSLSNSVKFERVLPLPSESTDPSDWFCHNSSNHQSTLLNLEPKEADVFYSYCYMHLNKNILNNVKINEKLIACKYCLSWLGLNNKPTIKLWSNTVKFLNKNVSNETSGLADVFVTIKSTFRNTLFNSIKLILCCQSSTREVDYILVWVLEKKLQILFSTPESQQQYNVAKVLFKFVSNNDSILDQWQNDPAVNIIPISKPMIISVLKHLHNFNKVFPTEYSKSNDFNVSYLFMYEQFKQ